MYLQKCSSLARSWEYKTQHRSGPTGSNTPRLKVWNSYSAPYTAGYICVSLTLLLLVSTISHHNLCRTKLFQKIMTFIGMQLNHQNHRSVLDVFGISPFSIAGFFHTQPATTSLTDVLLAAESALCDSTLAWQLGMRNLSLSAPRGMLGWAKILIECLIECWWLLMLILRRFSSKVQKHPFCGGSQQTSGCWWARFGVYFLFL